MMKRHNIFTIVSIFIAFVCNRTAFCQIDNNITYSLSAGYGYVAKTNDFMRGVNIDNTPINSIKSINFEINKEVDGSKAWHHLYKNFHYGGGLYHGIFNYSKNINNPYGLYAFIGFTPLEKKKFSLKTDIALGLSGIWDGFSSENPYNIAVSTPVECYAHARLTALYDITANWHITVAGSFIHFSNGTTKRPNKGINILTPSVGLAFNPKDIAKTNRYTPISFDKNIQHIFSAYAGVKGIYVEYDKSINNFTGDTIHDTLRTQYAVYGLQYRFMKALNFQHNIGWGLDISYNNTINRNKSYYYAFGGKDNTSEVERITMSAFFAYEYCIDRFSLLLEPIIYFHKPHKTYFPYFAQRIGMRYMIYKGWFAQIALRAYEFTKADYIEWGIGYRIKTGE